MTRKYISTELLIIFTALMIIANFIIYFSKNWLSFRFTFRLYFSVCRLPLFSQSKRAISILDWSIINSVYFII